MEISLVLAGDANDLDALKTCMRFAARGRYQVRVVLTPAFEHPGLLKMLDDANWDLAGLGLEPPPVLVERRPGPLSLLREQQA